MVVYKLTPFHHYISPPQVWALSFAARFDHWILLSLRDFLNRPGAAATLPLLSLNSQSVGPGVYPAFTLHAGLEPDKLITFLSLSRILVMAPM